MSVERWKKSSLFHKGKRGGKRTPLTTVVFQNSVIWSRVAPWGISGAEEEETRAVQDFSWGVYAFCTPQTPQRGERERPCIAVPSRFFNERSDDTHIVDLATLVTQPMPSCFHLERRRLIELQVWMEGCRTVSVAQERQMVCGYLARSAHTHLFAARLGQRHACIRDPLYHSLPVLPPSLFLPDASNHTLELLHPYVIPKPVGVHDEKVAFLYSCLE